jgi:isoleucyl-tRNA synthetase
MARELVNRIQNMRKQLYFNVTDRITVSLTNDKQVQRAVDHFGKYIKDEVLATDIFFRDQSDGEEVDLSEEVKIRMSLQLAN